MMAARSESGEVTRALNSLYDAAIALDRTGTRSAAQRSEVFGQLDELTAERRARLHLASGLVPNVVWMALFVSAALTIVFPLFFGSKNPVSQIAMTGILTVIVTLGLIVIVSLDYPFAGPVYVQPEPLQQALNGFG